MPTTYLVTSLDQLNTAIANVDKATTGDFVIQFGANITAGTSVLAGSGGTLTLDDNTTVAAINELYAINLKTGVTLAIDGNLADGATAGATVPGAQSTNFALDGNNHGYRGFFVYAGNVTFQDLTVQNTKAQGGSGGNGQYAGGGGAGLGGGLFVGSGGRVALSDVTFTNDQATGGGGGTGGVDNYGGGGGGLGGNGGASGGSNAGGGGGVGNSATGGMGQSNQGGPGIVLGTGYALSIYGYQAAGANGGGGGGSYGGGVGANSPTGGFGGGGGGRTNYYDTAAVHAGDGGFGGGGGGAANVNGTTPATYGGTGGFGGGGGAGLDGNGGSAFGGGSASSLRYVNLGAGGGGLGAGGAVFVQNGGTLTVLNGGDSGGTVAGGGGGGIYGRSGVYLGSANGGASYGKGYFLQGTSAVSFAAEDGQTLTISDDIADQYGSQAGTNPKASVTIGRAVSGGQTYSGAVTFSSQNSYSGGTTLVGGTFVVGSTAGAGQGGVTFSTGDQQLAIVSGALDPTTKHFANTIASFAAYGTDSIDLRGIGSTSRYSVTYDGMNSLLSVGGSSGAPGATLTLAGDYSTTGFQLTADTYGGTLVQLSGKTVPTATAVSRSVDEDQNGDARVAITLGGSSSATSFLIESLPGHGTLYADASGESALAVGGSVPASGGSGTVYYAQVPDYNGADSFDYAANDGTVTGASAAVALTINAVSDAPDQAASTKTNNALNVDVLAGDSFENTGRYVSAVSQGAHGTVTIDGKNTADQRDDTVVYTPNADYSGTDSFTYTVASGGVTETGTVSVAVNLPPTLSVADVTQNEGNAGTTSFTFTVQLSSPAPAGGVTFDIATGDGTARTADGDYTGNTLTGQTIAAGSSTYSFTVQVAGDTTFENDETFSVNVTNITAASNTSASATGTITNDDAAPVFSISAGPTVTEGDDLVFTVTRTGDAQADESVTVQTLDGTATGGSDYASKTQTLTFAQGGPSTQSFTVQTTDDGVYEGSTPETMAVLLSNATGGAKLSTTDRSSTGRIGDNEAAPTFALVGGTATEGGDVVFTINRTGPASQRTETLLFSTSNGSASAGSDYTAVTNQTVTFAPGATSATVAVHTTPDAVYEGTETFTGSISSPSEGSITAGSGSATGTITDAQTAPVYSITATPSSIAEGSYVSTLFTVSRTVATQDDQTVLINVLPSSTASPNDYTAVPSSVYFYNSDLSYSFPVGSSDDYAYEEPETLSLGLTVPADATVSSTDGSATITIVDNDPAPSFAISPETVTEPEGNAGSTAFTFTVTRTGDAQASETVQYAVSGSGTNAADGTDFTGGTLPTGTVTFAQGVMTQPITVNVAGDSTVESDEDFTVTLSDPNFGTVTTASATGTITNDDTVSGNGGDSGGGGSGGGGSGGGTSPFQFTNNADIYSGSNDPEQLQALDGNDSVSGAGGDDTISGQMGDDSLRGGDGNDTVYGGQGNDKVFGDAGDDKLFGNIGSDSIAGNLGNDTISGNQGLDLLFGGQGNDRIFGGQDADLVFGNLGDDLISGNMGDDTVYGGQGNDTLYGGQGADTLIGGLGNDVLFGDLGADRFVFGQNSGNDLINGFSQAEGDRLDLQGQTYATGSASDGSVILTLSGGGTVTLAGVQASAVNGAFFA